MYVVCEDFTDLQDGCRVYREGEVFPAAGVDVPDERIQELLGSNNRRGQPVIAALEDNPSQPDNPAAVDDPPGSDSQPKNQKNSRSQKKE